MIMKTRLIPYMIIFIPKTILKKDSLDGVEEEGNHEDVGETIVQYYENFDAGNGNREKKFDADNEKKKNEKRGNSGVFKKNKRNKDLEKKKRKNEYRTKRRWPD